VGGVPFSERLCRAGMKLVMLVFLGCLNYPGTGDILVFGSPYTRVEAVSWNPFFACVEILQTPNDHLLEVVVGSSYLF
jgi:hypothetical protein